MAAPVSSAASAQHEGDRRSLQAAKCALCGLELPLGLLVPDGGHACDDLRWYCKDAQSCTQRWTSHQRAQRQP